MNYVVVLMAAVALFAIIYWYAAGRYYYTGPRVKAQLIMGVEADASSNDEKKVPIEDAPRDLHLS